MARSRSADGMPDKIVAYVKNQKQHHADTTLFPEWEETYEEVAAAAESGPMG